jgi:hypothetical protein
MFEKSDVYIYENESNIYRRINKLLTYFLCLNGTAFVLGIITYGEKFLLWKYPLSFIGGTKTVTGIANTASWLIFSCGMILCSIVCFYISFLLRGENELKHHKFKQYLFLICGIGYLIILMPYNINNNIHAIGAGLIFGILWFLTVVFIAELNQIIKNYKILLYHLFLQGTVLPYAFLYFIHSPLQKQVQKIAVIGLMLVLKLVSAQNSKVYQKSMKEYS